MLHVVTFLSPAMHGSHLLGSLALDKPELLVIPPAEQRVLKNEHIVVLLDLVEIVHVELDAQ